MICFFFIDVRISLVIHGLLRSFLILRDSFLVVHVLYVDGFRYDTCGLREERIMVVFTERWLMGKIIVQFIL